MDPILIIAAFIFGAITSHIGLPPLVGYLVAGFILNGMGIEAGDQLELIADVGVTLLLFSIGLKLRLKSLARPEVWGGSMVHMGITVAIFGTGMVLLGILGLPVLRSLTWQTAFLAAFALSFSSTVFAVKVFEQKNEMASRHGVIAIGILIVQDIVAVIFLAFSSGKIPSLWAVALVAGLILIRPLLLNFMSKCGHGELLMLFGILMTFAGYESFELVGLKGDLGALVFGVLVASHPKASELAKALLGFKDLFLVGFFLNIGISGSPTLAAVGIAVLLAMVMPVKAALYFGVLSRFRLRARTAFLASASLANYSEFGLIVAAIGVGAGWIDQQWLMIIAIALSCTFVMAASINASIHRLYARWAVSLKRFESNTRLPDHAFIENQTDPRIIIFGMGRLGAAAYDEMQRRFGDVVAGVDFCQETVDRHLKKGRRTFFGDASDSDFWEGIDPSATRIDLVMLTLPDPKASRFAIDQLKSRGYRGQITASVRHEDEISILREAGIDAAYVLYEEAGVGFADHACKHTNQCPVADQGG